MRKRIVGMFLVLFCLTAMSGCLTLAKSTKQSDTVFEEEQTGIYNYCPTVSTDQEGNMNIFYCRNRRRYRTEDCIYYCNSRYKENKQSYVYSNPILVLEPSEEGWDSEHVCDPSVIKGNFQYQGINYSYLMAFLGCNTTDNQKNEIGLAVSNSLSGGWIKIDANPIIEHGYSDIHKDDFQWGVGQPSLISVDYLGKVLLFYTCGTYDTTSEKVSLWDFSDLDHPICIGTADIGEAYMRNYISNADFAVKDDILYMICDLHPFSGVSLTNVADASMIYTAVFPELELLDEYEDIIWGAAYLVDQDKTGYSKNHNACFIRDEYGRLSQSGILYTSATDYRNFAKSVYSYRIRRLDF